MRTHAILTAPDWLCRIRHVTAEQYVRLGTEPDPWSWDLCMDLLRNEHGSSPEFKEAVADFQAPVPVWSGGV